MTAPECGRPGCRGGRIMVTGFCDTCLRRPAVSTPFTDPEVSDPSGSPDNSTGPTGSGGSGGSGEAEGTDPAARRPSSPGELDRDGLPVLPDLPSPEPSEAADLTARPPSGGRRCGVDNCPGTIGVPYDDGPAPDHGYCPDCGTPYSFRPKLRPGDLVAGHYRVLGYLAVGGHGWIYLAEDTRVPDLHVVLKGLINSGDAVARRAAVEERRSLTTLHHPDIVRIITYVQHRAPDDAEPTGYLVMEYAGGRSLAWITRFASDEELTRLLGGPLEFGHVITYGCMILGALEYLHDQGLLYCDMKPENVIHFGRRVKVIDLGAIRPVDDRGSLLTYTRGYAPGKKELTERGFHVDSDLFTVGRTLKALADRATAPVGLAARSFDALIRRATHPEPAARFTSAAEMSRQLWEVLREHRSLGGHEPYPERSTRFDPTAAVFGASLGAVPELTHWTSRAGGPAGAPVLSVEAPDPREVALALPVPRPHAADEAAVLLDRLAADTPDRVAERARHDPGLRTVEAFLWLCRAYLDAGDADKADACVRRATGAPGRTGDYDWRIFWHRGLVHLARGDVRGAEGEFTAAHHALPGEWAPKLALGYCAEYAEAASAGTGAADREWHASHYYEAVWKRDPTQAGAAFGLARVHLRRGERDRAVAVLDDVPSTSRHHDAARVATVRLLACRTPGGPAPRAAELEAAAGRLAALRLDDGYRQRLVAELREQAWACRPPGGWGDGFPAGELFGPSDTPQALADRLSRSLKHLAGQARGADEHGDLLDLAYAVLPEPVVPWPRFRVRFRVRGRRRTA